MQIRILVIDDAAFVRDALKRAIRRFLKEVDIFDAVNGRRALPILRSNKINLIICEWELAEMSGAEVLQWLREDKGYAKTPFIVMSDGNNRNMVMNAIKMGASDFLTKPFSPDEVQKKVVKQLARLGFKARPPNPGGLASGLDVLTTSSGGGGNKKAPQAASVFGKPKAKPKGTKNAPQRKPSNTFSGTAHIHFGDSFSSPCDIKELSLSGLSGIVKRTKDQILTLFDEVDTEIENAKGEPLSQLKAYIHSIEALEATPSSQNIRLTLRFLENAPEKFELLSKAIARS